MFNNLESIFSDLTVHRPKRLEGLELNAYISEIKLALEYIGKQHYKPVELFGAEERLLIQKENDL